MIKKVTITSLPGSIKRMAMPFAETINIYECTEPSEVIESAKKHPLEMTLIAQTSKKNIIERYFLISWGVPAPVDSFKTPLLYFSAVSGTYVKKYKKLVENYMKNKGIIWASEN